MRKGPILSAERVLELKAEATALKTSTPGLKQTAALARVAQREGFRSWEELISLAGGRDAVDEVKRDRPPTEALMRRAERRAQRMQRYGQQ